MASTKKSSPGWGVKDATKPDILDIFRTKSQLKAANQAKQAKWKQQKASSSSATPASPASALPTPPATAPAAPAIPNPEAAKSAAVEVTNDGFTPEQDAKILEMKAEGKSWAHIGEAVGSTKNIVRTRHHELAKAKEEANNGGEAKADDAEAKKKKEEEGRTKAAEKKEKKKNESKSNGEADGSKEESKKEANNGTVNGGTQAQVVNNVGIELPEIVALCNLATRYDQDKWATICSRFYDETGKRISPDKAKQLVGSK